MQDLCDIYEILLKDREALIKKIKPNIQPLVAKYKFFMYIPIFRITYETMLIDAIEQQLLYELSNLTYLPIYDIMSILEDDEIQQLLRDSGYYDKENYR